MAKTPNSTTSTLDAASGLALMLSVIAFFFSSFAVIQATKARQETPPQTSSGGGGAPTEARPLLGFLDPNRSQQVQPGQFVQSAYEGGGQVEILSAYRGSNPEQVHVRLSVKRLQPRIQGNGDINLLDAKAINTRTNMSYGVANVRTPGNEPILLYRLPLEQATQATLTLAVPAELRRIDLSIPHTDVFRNVPIAQPQG